MAGFSGLRNRVECPDQAAGLNMERTNVARTRLVLFVCGRSQDEQVFEKTFWSALKTMSVGEVVDDVLLQCDALCPPQRRSECIALRHGASGCGPGFVLNMLYYGPLEPQWFPDVARGGRHEVAVCTLEQV